MFFLASYPPPGPALQVQKPVAPSPCITNAGQKQLMVGARIVAHLAVQSSALSRETFPWAEEKGKKWGRKQVGLRRHSQLIIPQAYPPLPAGQLPGLGDVREMDAGPRDPLPVWPASSSQSGSSAGRTLKPAHRRPILDQTICEAPPTRGRRPIARESLDSYLVPPRQRALFCGECYQHIRMYDLNSNNPNPVINYDGVSKNITSVGFHEDGRWMYTGGEDCMARIWDLRPQARGGFIWELALTPE
ncbi:target of rapamycin complex subunit lst8 [Crotalus adamanteus]|uniref:Target of rapamycin complex subunit lst8 n=1 Tax=Crotalus adamanteus TaxID=8729 RepID=A0AAW1AVY8_CROAD